jgi:redox-sensitive bicupin YhaK (pirin superfamily)
VPDRRGIAPRYAQERYSDEEKKGRLRLIGSPNGDDGSIVVHQDVRIFSALLDSGQAVTHDVAKGRRAWVQMVRGSAEIDAVPVEAGDGVAAQDQPSLSMVATRDATELIVFDLP